MLVLPKDHDYAIRMQNLREKNGLKKFLLTPPEVLNSTARDLYHRRNERRNMLQKARKLVAALFGCGTLAVTAVTLWMVLNPASAYAKCCACSFDGTYCPACNACYISPPGGCVIVVGCSQ